MKKFSLFAVSLCLTAFSFAQNQGQWSFGAGGDFTAPDANANIGYFAMDGLMVSFDFNMGLGYEDECTCSVGTDHAAEDMSHDVDGEFSWGAAVRYYAVDNMFVREENREFLKIKLQRGEKCTIIFSDEFGSILNRILRFYIMIPTKTSSK